MAHKIGNSEKRLMRTSLAYVSAGKPGKRMVDASRADRLRRARQAAGYVRAVDAVRAFGWKRSTYYGHENARRGIARDQIVIYAEAFRVTRDWLASGRGPMRGHNGPRTIRIEGYVDNLGIEPEDHGIEITELPQGINPNDFIAYKMRGDTNYPWQANDIILVARNPGPPEDYLGQLCAVTARSTGAKIIRRLMAGTRPGVFLLLSPAAGAPMIDIEITEATPIIWTKHG
jgi:hypothetical protein